MRQKNKFEIHCSYSSDTVIQDLAMAAIVNGWFKMELQWSNEPCLFFARPCQDSVKVVEFANVLQSSATRRIIHSVMNNETSKEWSRERWLIYACFFYEKKWFDFVCLCHSLSMCNTVRGSEKCRLLLHFFAYAYDCVWAYIVNESMSHFVYVCSSPVSAHVYTCACVHVY